MVDYQGIACPVCGKEFGPQDDVVVCPDCGAPYHRDCYQQVGHCVYQDKHGPDFVWERPHVHAQHTDDGQNGEKTKLCPRCSARNYPDALFCDKCGQPFAPGGQQGYPFPGAQRGSQQGGFPGGFPGGVPFVFDPMGGVAPGESLNGVPAGDVAKLVKQNTTYYLPIFKRIQDTGASKFNFCAFLFSGGWLLYRKQYKKGILFILLTALLLVGALCVQVFWVDELMRQMAAQAGISTIASTTDMMKVYEQFYTLNAGQKLLFFLPTILHLLQWVVMFIVGFNGNRMYMKHCTSTVARIRTEATGDAEYAERLQEAGGVNMPLAICLLVCYMMLQYIPMFL